MKVFESCVPRWVFGSGYWREIEQLKDAKSNEEKELISSFKILNWEMSFLQVK